MTDQTRFKTCVIMGLGYIGLPTSVVVARSGINVIGVDVRQSTVETVNAGGCPIDEPHLPEALSELVSSGSIKARSKPQPGDVFIIAVPTPFAGGYKPDLTHVEAATRAIAPLLDKGNLVIVESTIPIGATEQVARWIENLRPDLSCSRRNSTQVPDVLVAHCPERVLPGQMLKELVENDRVIGGVCQASASAGQAFYQTFVKGKCLATDARTAELCKLTENSFRDVNIAFANELADICEDKDVNVWELIELANHHPRVNILRPGPGVGGHCIAVDPWFIVSALGERARLIREARWLNSGRPRQVVRKALQHVASGGIRSIACFGLSYKADVDDLRESPAVEVVDYLTKEFDLLSSGVELLVVEPHINTLPSQLKESATIRLVDIDTALACDLILMLVDHKEFLTIPTSRLDGKMVIDTCGVWRNAGGWGRSDQQEQQSSDRSADAA